MLSAAEAILVIAVIAAVTFFTRGLPFLLFAGRKTPAYILYLGRVLPLAIIGMLVVYCLKSVSVIAHPFGIPEAIAIAFIAAIHLWKKNSLISIIGGTLLYMVLVQIVFI